MTTEATAVLSGTAVRFGRIVMPYGGIFHADVVLVDESEPAGPQTLTFMGVTMKMAVVRAISYVGSRGVRLIGGAGGWRTTVPAQQFSNPAGLRVSTIVGATASSVGEQVSLTSDPICGLDHQGVTYARSNGKASLVLNDPAVLGTSWWMDFNGIVQNSTRSTTLITSAYVCQAVQGAAGIYTIATEFPGDWIPGRTFANTTVSGQVNRVTHFIDGTSIRAEVMVS